MMTPPISYWDWGVMGWVRACFLDDFYGLFDCFVKVLLIEFARDYYIVSFGTLDVVITLF